MGTKNGNGNDSQRIPAKGYQGSSCNTQVGFCDTMFLFAALFGSFC